MTRIPARWWQNALAMFPCIAPTEIVIIGLNRHSLAASVLACCAAVLLWVGLDEGRMAAERREAHRTRHSPEV